MLVIASVSDRREPADDERTKETNTVLKHRRFEEPTWIEGKSARERGIDT